ncbi:MAG: cadherin-like beta sandwich domain-containing protein, partial [Bacilli bacterium]|nr:cadherin-like beta sandwich domain-containing protein [Bacilli bacterium]
MKKTIKYIGLLILLLIPFNVFGISYKLDTPKKGTGGVTYIDISVTDVAGLKQTEVLTCSTTDKDKVDCTIETNPTNKDLKKEGNIIVGTTEFTENQVVGRLAIKNKTYEEVITKAIFEVNGSTYGNPVENVTIEAAKKPASKDSSITKLSINNGTMNPEFKSDVTEYTIYGFPDTIKNIKFTYECDNCSVNGTNKTNRELTVGLAIGENDVKLTSKSEDGTTSTVYTFKVFRGSTTYNSLKLKSLSVEGFELDPKFDKETKEYTIKVPKKVESIESLLKYETEDEKAKVKVEGAGTLDKDENEVKLTITNQTGDTSEIKIKVIKEDQTASVIEII